jgi:hypothetical protein
MQATSIDVSFSDLLARAVSEPRIVRWAYSTFHGCSLGTQLLALLQRFERDIEPGQIATCRGYIQHWNTRRGVEPIPERSAQRIFKVADTLLRAGRADLEHALAA